MIETENKKRKFPEVYSDYYAIVFSTAYSKIGNRDDAADITQEVFTRLCKKFEEVDDPRKWLFFAVKNVIKEHRRKSGDAEADIDNMDDVGMTFVNGFRDARIIIQEAIENMENFGTENGRLLFELIAVCGFTYQEAASELGVSRRQAEYGYGIITARIINYLNKRGIKSVQDLL
jgi:RNA polymerase sigma factor (sigma-70 family)